MPANNMAETAAAITLPAEIDHARAAEVTQALRAAVRTQGVDGRVLVDAAALQKFDSSALAVLLELWRTAQAQGQPWHVTGASLRLQNLAALYGVDHLLLAS